MKDLSSTGRLLVRTQHRLRPDVSRTLCRLFVPGQETLIRGGSRAMAVIDRVLELSEHEVERALARTLARFSDRHRDLAETMEHNFGLVAHRLGAQIRVGRARRRLIGAYFTQEYALEAAALFNPSMVAHPDQAGCPSGTARFVMSLRAVGEGHLSSIEFRTGTIGSDSEIRFDPPGRFLDTGCPRSVPYDRDLFQEKLTELGHNDENARFLWSTLPSRFTSAELDAALAELSNQHVTRGDSAVLADRVRWMAACNYAVDFDEQHALSERVLWPSGPAESHGMEDARFVRFADGEDDPVYYATYTAFDGSQVEPQLLETSDFRTFTVSQLSGPSARNKGMALFPRRIGGRYAALSRWDRESNAIGYSDDGRRWSKASTVQVPTHPWELIQLGNCGSPIETPVGWLVFTHGVGPMREYAIGVTLLDLDEPERQLAALPEPLLVADESEREGYVPNVVYSCGPMIHGGTIVLPYGCSDSSVRTATVDLSLLLDRLMPG
ncbi:MAG TPA: glycoside hydrolase family 130 protein [Streptosporangiaceae bacterium]|nr:glycoside hydrolase family 130 protein [Streptosporangiaceae bacterium]